MREITYPRIEEYCVEHTTPLPSLFEDLKKETYEKTTAPQMQVGTLEGSFLKFLVGISQAQNVLELGTFTGFSSLAMAEALPESGRLVTCDIDAKNTMIAKNYWSKTEHGRKIELRLGPAIDTLANLNMSFDLVFIDADKGNYIKYWEAVVPMLSPRGIVVVDNVLWSGRVLDPKEDSDKAITAFNEHAKADQRMEIVMLPIRDGMLLARKRTKLLG